MPQPYPLDETGVPIHPVGMNHGYQLACCVVFMRVGPLVTRSTGTSFHVRACISKVQLKRVAKIKVEKKNVTGRRQSIKTLDEGSK